MNNKQIAAELVRIAGMLMEKSSDVEKLSANKKQEAMLLAKGLLNALQKDDIKLFQSQLRELNQLSGMKKLV